MDFFSLLTLFGGLAMFLYGMRLMGDSLKESSSGTLKVAMEHVTNNPVKAFLLGLAVTAIIQSSTATIVITSGLVAAGILSLHQSLGIIIGANVGTTVTGQIIRLLDIDESAGSILRLFKPSSLAPIALIVGIILIMGFRFKDSRSFGNIAIGFGILFSGLMNMTGAVDVLADKGVFDSLFANLGDNPFLGYLTGAAVAFILQSSSATIGILQAFSASGLLAFKSIYAVIVGVYLGDCVTTAIVCSIGAKAEARRVGIVNILFNLGKSVLVLVGVTIVHHMGLLDNLWNARANSGMIANTNTIFNICCAVALFPMLGTYERLSHRIVKDEPVPENPYREKLEALNPVFFRSPALALRSSYDILIAMMDAARKNISIAMDLLVDFNGEKQAALEAEEENIDIMTDHVSHYLVELLPNINNQRLVAILDQYYRVVPELERLGDHAVNIANAAADMNKHEVRFSDAALAELAAMRRLLTEILDNAEQALQRRDLDSAYRIHPLGQVADEMIASMKVRHLNRMVRGECSVYADANYMNLLTDLKRISDVSANIGEAVVIRANPEIADQEHDYFSSLNERSSESFRETYYRAHETYLGELKQITQNAENSAKEKQSSAPADDGSAEKSGKHGKDKSGKAGKSKDKDRKSGDKDKTKDKARDKEKKSS